MFATLSQFRDYKDSSSIPTLFWGVGDIFSNEISSLTHLCTITSKVIKKIELETRLHTSFHDQAKFLKTTGLWLRAVK